MLTGEMLIGTRTVRGTQVSTQAINPATGEQLSTPFPGGTSADVDFACTLAEAAFNPYRALPLESRAVFLETIAQGLIDLGDTLIDRVIAESGLPRPRIEGERGRTVGQLRLFAAIAREGRYLNATIDPALPERKPLPRADLRAQFIPLGPVAVFGASNFPLAFSVAGGDTASAFAAGCPVVAKSHPSHLGTSELVGRVIQQAAIACNLPEGVFSLLVDSPSNEVATALVQHPAIQAVGFTGSRKVGLHLVALAAARQVPIPVYAEMSSINPVFFLPAALAARAEAIGQGLIDSVTLGTGQFCTKPGLAIGVAGPDFDRFRAAAQSAVSAKPSTNMLNAGIQRAFTRGASQWSSDGRLQPLATGSPSESPCTGQPILFATTATHFLRDQTLLEEVFGPAAILIECSTPDELIAVATHLNGQLTVTLHLSEKDHALAATLLPILERKAGRILCNGFPTGVEVTHAMVHGGPYPSTSNSRVTSVGSMAIDRFLRPVCYQDIPTPLLPPALQPDNPLNLARLIDGKLQIS